MREKRAIIKRLKEQLKEAREQRATKRDIFLIERQLANIKALY